MHEINQVDTNKFEIVGSGTPKRLTYLGDGDWLLSIGVNTVENMKKGRFKTLQFSSLERLESQYPEWKGISLIFQSACPNHEVQIFH